LLRSQIFLEAASHINYLLYADKSREEIQKRINREVESKVKTKMSVAENDTRTLQEVEKDRLLENKKKEVKLNGERLSKTGACAICGKESVAITCSPACKDQWKVVEPWTKMGMSKAQAMEYVKQLGLGGSVQ
jgi:hypothetical protein